VLAAQRECGIGLGSTPVLPTMQNAAFDLQHMRAWQVGEGQIDGERNVVCGLAIQAHRHGFVEIRQWHALCHTGTDLYGLACGQAFAQLKGTAQIEVAPRTALRLITQLL